MSASQSLVESPEAPCGPECPIQRVSQVLDGKWTILVLRDLLSGKKRYSQLQRGLKGISPRLLALRLRTLEQQGLLTRCVYPTNPPTTEYELTARGLAMRDIFAAMAAFGTSL